MMSRYVIMDKEHPYTISVYAIHCVVICVFQSTSFCVPVHRSVRFDLREPLDPISRNTRVVSKSHRSST